MDAGFGLSRLMSSDTLPHIKIPPELVFTVSESEERTLQMFLELEDPVSAPDNLVIVFRIISARGTVCHTLQRMTRTNLGQGFLVCFLKKAKSGRDELLTLFMKESKMNSHDKLTAGFFHGQPQYCIKLIYKPPAPKPDVRKLLPAPQEFYPGAIVHASGVSTMAQDFGAAIIGILRKDYAKLGPKKFAEKMEKLLGGQSQPVTAANHGPIAEGPSVAVPDGHLPLAPMETAVKSDSNETVVYNDEDYNDLMVD